MTDDPARRTLARLARVTPGADAPDPAENEDGPVNRTDRETIERAVEAVADVHAAAAFCDDVGLDELERAVERAERSVSGCAADGRDALASFRAFRRAAAGDHFRSGRGTSLGGGDVARRK